MTQAVITAVLTVAIGTLVFVLGQMVLVLFIERIRLQARTIEEIAEAIVQHAPEYSTLIMRDESLPTEEHERLMNASDEIRRLSARLRASAVTLRYYQFFQALRLVLPKSHVIKASSSLIGLSNVIPPRDQFMISDGRKFREEIEEYLDIKIPKPQTLSSKEGSVGHL